MVQLTRQMIPADAAEIARIFHDAVQIGTAPDYTQAQRDAWSPMARDPSVWIDRLAGQVAIVATTPCGLSGFMTLRDDGYLDCAFVDPAHQGTGVARGLHDALLDHAAHAGHTQLWSDISLTAEPAFLAMGWRIKARQTVIKNGETLRNARMIRDL